MLCRYSGSWRYIIGSVISWQKRNEAEFIVLPADISSSRNWLELAAMSLIKQLKIEDL
jgi:hypothetical protein